MDQKKDPQLEIFRGASNFTRSSQSVSNHGCPNFSRGHCGMNGEIEDKEIVWGVNAEARFLVIPADGVGDFWFHFLH
jgi:hypothetical protein